jgi:hypothetical protein
MTFLKNLGTLRIAGFVATLRSAGPLPTRSCSLNSFRLAQIGRRPIFNVRAQRKFSYLPRHYGAHLAPLLSVHEAAHPNIHNDPQRQKHEQQ